MTLRSAIAAFSIGTSRVERPARDDEAADVLRQVARKAAQLLGQDQPLLDARRCRIEARLGEALRPCSRRPTRPASAASASMRSMSMPSARPTSRSAERAR
jgi:hypothetical protein